MPRAVWSGTISFSMVNVPVGLYTATSEKTVRFNQVSSLTGARVRQKRVDGNTGAEVPYESIVKGYEISPDHYVVVTQEELDAIAPEKTRAISIEQFVPLAEIDPIQFSTNYWVGPADDVSKNAYALLSRALEAQKVVGIGRFVLRSKESLVALRAIGGHLAVTLLRWADEINSPERVLGDVQGTVAERELQMAETLVSSLTTAWKPEKFKDEYREKVIALIERKAKGLEIPAAEEAEAPASPPDLMAALEASLAAVQSPAKAAV